MNVRVHKNKATSRCSGQRHDVPESHMSNVATLRSNVATFQWIRLQTSRCSSECKFQCRDVEISRNDVPESSSKLFFQ